MGAKVVDRQMGSLVTAMTLAVVMMTSLAQSAERTVLGEFFTADW